MSKIKELYQKYKEIINYLIFGVLTTVVSLVTYYICVFTVLDPDNAIQLQSANVISWIISVAFAYITNRKFVFESKEKNKIKEEQNTSNTTQEYIEKSGNNYLKSLKVEGYKLEPEFNMQQDNYIVYVDDKSRVKNLNIIAEPDDERAKIEGTGVIEITPEQQLVNVNVIAENGNLKVYTIKVENRADRPEDKSRGVMVMITTVIVVLIISGVVIIADKKSKHK